MGSSLTPILSTLATGLLGVALVAAFAAPAHAFDRDGERTRARALAMDKTHEDSVSESDRADWGYIEFTKDGKITVTLTTDPGESIVLALTNSDGKILAESKKADSKGTHVINLSVNTGIYYVMVKASGTGKCAYKLEVARK